MKLEPAIIWKIVTFQVITSKNTRPRWADTWARDTVRKYWSADTLFWQLSIDHNIDVQYVCNISFPMLPNELESLKSNIGFPVTYPWCFAGALCAELPFKHVKISGRDIPKCGIIFVSQKFRNQFVVLSTSQSSQLKDHFIHYAAQILLFPVTPELFRHSTADISPPPLSVEHHPTLGQKWVTHSPSPSSKAMWGHRDSWFILFVFTWRH